MPRRRSKDVGLIATEKGYNLYVCGNGGSKPRHAELLASDLDEETALKYIDRFLMYYIMTADRLTRTSVWCEKLEGGIDHIRDVVVHDKLGIAAELEAQLQHLVDTYRVRMGGRRARSGKAKMVPAVRQHRRNGVVHRNRFRARTEPARRLAQRCRGRSISSACWMAAVSATHETEQAEQTCAGCAWRQAADFPLDGGATIKYGQTQIAVFNFASRGQWYACQNMCPHKKAFVLSRGILGDAGGEPKVACPLHKKTFSLESGESLQGEEYRIRTFPVKVEDGDVYFELPPVEVLDKLLATEIGCNLATLVSSNGVNRATASSSTRCSARLPACYRRRTRCRRLRTGTMDFYRRVVASNRTTRRS